MNDISNTALVTLKCHVQDAEQEGAVLNDQSAFKAFEYLDAVLDQQGRRILHNRLKGNLVRHTATRARKYDEYAVHFLREHPTATIVNIGCGLDHRFERIDNGQCVFYDLDLPDLMEIKKNIFPANERYRQLANSVFDLQWIRRIDGAPLLLLAEGVLMFCAEKDVKALFEALHMKVPGCNMVFEVFSSKWLRGWKKIMVDFKLRRQLKFGKYASFQFGIEDSDDIERWSEHYKLIDEWSYVDVIKPNAGDGLRKIQWTVHYKIN